MANDPTIKVNAVPVAQAAARHRRRQMSKAISAPGKI
jgi:hypothetical protein